ncbi:hypothetical protein CCMA1212_004300 [Trichoderma ghanense]|uniref:Uncharacterized protein n=1 Tax=Trichoderma ghanense TaxID=65468 RepID=A0ABY2H5C5_9HYPO
MPLYTEFGAMYAATQTDGAFRSPMPSVSILLIDSHVREYKFSSASGKPLVDRVVQNLDGQPSPNGAVGTGDAWRYTSLPFRDLGGDNGDVR